MVLTHTQKYIGNTWPSPCFCVKWINISTCNAENNNVNQTKALHSWLTFSYLLLFLVIWMLVKERWDFLLWFGLLGHKTESRRMNSMNCDMDKKGERGLSAFSLWGVITYISLGHVVSQKPIACMLKHLFRFYIGGQIRSQFTIIKDHKSGKFSQNCSVFLSFLKRFSWTVRLSNAF